VTTTVAQTRAAAAAAARGRVARVLEPRLLHPGAWWLWALALATAATRTTNPVVLGLIVAVAAVVVAARRTPAPWTRAFTAFLALGVVLLVVRLLVTALVMDTQPGGTVLVTLPEVGLPAWFAGLRLGGDVAAEPLVFALYQGLQLLAVLACVGAANALADPRRLLRTVPGALYEVGVSLVVALTYAPRLVEDASRVRAAQRLRGRTPGGLRGLARTAVPVLEGALASSIDLAAAMDSRGFARAGDVPVRLRRATAALVLTGLVGVGIGLFGLLGGGTLPWAGTPLVALGVALAVAGALLAGRRSQRTRYRPDPWRLPEWVTVGSGLLVAAAVVAAASRWPAAIDPAGRVPLVPLEVPLPLLLALLAGAAPAVLTPPPPLPARAPRPAPLPPALPAGAPA
jgi:energy-coupling factor transport system permease protein